MFSILKDIFSEMRKRFYFLKILYLKIGKANLFVKILPDNKDN